VKQEDNMRFIEGSIEEIQTQEAYNIGVALKRSIAERYGVGSPLHVLPIDEAGNMFEPREPKAFHNLHHTEMVEDSAVRLGLVLGFRRPKLARLALDAVGHDNDHTGTRGVDEASSAEGMVEQLVQTNWAYDREIFGPRDMMMSRLAILGTEPLLRDGALVGQKASEQDYPDAETEEYAKALASADLGELYTPLGPYVGHEYYREIMGFNSFGAQPPLTGLENFQRQQLDLLENYQYPLATAEKVLATHKPTVIRYGAHVLRQLERGDIESWDQVMAQDYGFYREQLAA
jgi:hypothetical protein